VTNWSVNFNLTRIRIRILNPSSLMHTSLDHEKLEVYQASLEFITWTIPLLERLPASASVRNQLDRASTSVPLNIAEGNGKFTSPDRCRFFDNARGSALESGACLDVMVAKRFVSVAKVQAGKAVLVKIVSMLFGLIRANSDVRVFEEPASYRAEKPQNEEGKSRNTKKNKSRSKNRNMR
jgi:four helix bundle protein